jgi:hypothetical protein
LMFDVGLMMSEWEWGMGMDYHGGTEDTKVGGEKRKLDADERGLGGWTRMGKEARGGSSEARVGRPILGG